MVVGCIAAVCMKWCHHLYLLLPLRTASLRGPLCCRALCITKTVGGLGGVMNAGNSHREEGKTEKSIG